MYTFIRKPKGCNLFAATCFRVVILTAGLSTQYAYANVYSNEKPAEDTKTITEYLKELAHNVKEYAKEKTETQKSKFDSTMEKIRERVKHANVNLQRGLLQRQDEALARYNAVKEKNKEREEEAYNRLLEELEVLNKDIEKSIQAERHR